MALSTSGGSTIWLSVQNLDRFEALGLCFFIGASGPPKSCAFTGSITVGEFCTRPLTNCIIAACSLYSLEWVSPTGRCDLCELVVDRVLCRGSRLADISARIRATSFSLSTTRAAALSAASLKLNVPSVGTSSSPRPALFARNSAEAAADSD